MATNAPVRSSIANGIEVITWSLVSTADTNTGTIISGAAGAIGSMMVTGTFGGGTVALQGSNDGSNYYNLTDMAGNIVTLTAAGIKDFSTAAAYIAPKVTGGTGDDVTVTVVLRG